MTRDEILDQIIEWWLSRSNIDKDNLRFHRDKTRVTTIRLSQQMFTDASSLAKANNITLNRLIERLLFEELGRPSVYLKASTLGDKQESLELEEEDKS